MKAVVIYEPGGPEKLVFTEVETPTVKKGWSLVRIRGFGINHSEIFTRKGLSPSVRFPRIPGIECVGTVEETTSEKLRKGQKVISIMGEIGRDFDGSYAEYVLLPNSQIYPVNTEMPWEKLAAVPETFYTAFGSMLNLKIDMNDTVLVRGATSGVGIAFMKLLKAKYPDISITGTSRAEKKKDRLKQEGFDEVIIDRKGVLETDRTFSKVLDLVGPFSSKDTFRHTEKNGIVCSSGQLGGKWYIEEFDPIIDLPANGYLTSFYSGNVSNGKLQQMLDYIEEYNVEARAEKVFSLEEAPLAHEYLESSRSFGKCIVVL